MSHLSHLGSIFLILLFQQEFANLFLAEVAAPENLTGSVMQSVAAVIGELSEQFSDRGYQLNCALPLLF